MRFLKTMLLVSVLVMGASAANAGNMTFGLGGGVSSPTGDLSDGYKMGFNGGVYGDYWIKPDYAFGVDITGNFLSAKDDIITALKTTAYPDPKLKTTLINFGAHGIWAIPMKDAPAQPYITYGAGIYNFSTKLTGTAVESTDSQSKFGFNGGVGVDMKAGEMMKAGVDFKYHYIMDAIQSTGTSKKAANYFTAGVHLTFKTSK